MKKKRVKRGTDKRRNKRTIRRQSKEDVRIVFLMKAFEIFSQEGDLGSCGDLSWEDLLETPEDPSDREPDSCALARVVTVVTDVPVSPSSVVTEFCDGLSLGSDWEDVVPQSFSFSKKRAHYFTRTQEEMRYEGSQGKASPMMRRRMSPGSIKVHRRVVWGSIFIVFGVYLVKAEVQEDQAHKGIAREVHPDLLDDIPWMRKRMTMWEEWCLKQKRKKNSQGKGPNGKK